MSTELLAPIVLDRALAVTDTAARSEDVCSALDTLALLKRRVKEVSDAIERDVIAWIRTNGELTIGDIRYYVGQDRTWKCTDTKAVYEALMQRTGGDVDVMLGCLASGAWKQAQTRKVLGETPFFREEVKDDLLTGKPKDKLCKVDPKWLD